MKLIHPRGNLGSDSVDRPLCLPPMMVHPGFLIKDIIPCNLQNTNVRAADAGTSNCEKTYSPIIIRAKKTVSLRRSKKE